MFVNLLYFLRWTFHTKINNAYMLKLIYEIRSVNWARLTRARWWAELGHYFLGTTRLYKQILNNFRFWRIKLIHKKNHDMARGTNEPVWTWLLSNGHGTIKNGHSTKQGKYIINELSWHVPSLLTHIYWTRSCSKLWHNRLQVFLTYSTKKLLTDKTPSNLMVKFHIQYCDSMHHLLWEHLKCFSFPLTWFMVHKINN